ncbi:hypothetical protein [Hallella absiana]|nr:hypothetical protein [Hallella absiana]
MFHHSFEHMGVDLNGFTPLSWNQVKEKIEFQMAYDTNVSHWIK